MLIDSFGSWGGVEVPVAPLWLICSNCVWTPCHLENKEWAAGQARGSSTSLPARLSCCIFSGFCSLYKAAKPVISCLCGSGHFNFLSVFIETYTVPASTAKAAVVQLYPWVPASSSLSLHLPRVWMLVPSMAQHRASEVCLLMSLFKLPTYFISLSVKTHHQPVCDFSVPKTTRVWAGFFFFFPCLYKNVSKT